jgi:signal transduction histidine kinase
MQFSASVGRPGLRLTEGLGNPVQLWLSGKPFAAGIFLLLSFVLGLFWFITLVTLISLGFGLAITFIGLPLLAATAVLWTWGARAERWRVGVVTGVPIDQPYRQLPEGPLLRRLRAFATDPPVWRDLGYLLLLFPLGIIEFVVLMLCIFVPLGMLMQPLHYLWTVSNPALAGRGYVPPLAEVIVLPFVGVAALAVVPYVLIGVMRGHAVLARALLGPTREELTARVDELTESRSRMMDAALTERRRIERDLHDGAQQRLVALSMELGMAKIKFDSDPAAARALVDEAHREAKLAMAEIRNLVQGIHPAVLTDRGLDAALSSLAGRCPVPVAVDVELDRRLPEVVESAAYFFVSEALTNVAKHSVATEAYIYVRQVGGTLVVEVSDNGLGGAEAANGTGLAGLADRIAALDGRLTVESPAGRGTRLRAEIPSAA